ncbi:hypothetical protein BCR43DRAFT_496070 [Syncephalastrum racemosum]|uniref:NAD(P)-binding domain-containing protein n=1 Tax=Syncephalastrum racemosum TaxID=13706 RepID=A0A1X2H701_SYNRA|nr:hypothetical protein BCR43DRAFT_496070 [Syncephalastrum racemosum]
MSERVYIVGGTGDIGSLAAKDLIKHNVPVTVLARDPEKAQKLFPGAGDLLRVVKGDYDDLETFEKTVQGHSRMFLLVKDMFNMPKIKQALAERAYAAGVKQIVDISSRFATFPYRSSFIGHMHRQSEEAMLAIPNRGRLVCLRPSKFMTNHFWFAKPMIQNANVLADILDLDAYDEYISTWDIAELASIVLRDDIEKHQDLCYELIGDSVTTRERAAVFSKVLGREIAPKQVAPEEQYKQAAQHMPHCMAIDLIHVRCNRPKSPALSVVLGRQPESFEDWVTRNKAAFESSESFAL